MRRAWAGCTKAEDMQVQHRRLAHTRRRSVTIVTDSSAALPDSVLDQHGIALGPLQVIFGNSTFRDRVELKPEEFYRRLRGAAELPTTSQPGSRHWAWACWRSAGPNWRRWDGPGGESRRS